MTPEQVTQLLDRIANGMADFNDAVIVAQTLYGFMWDDRVADTARSWLKREFAGNQCAT